MTEHNSLQDKASAWESTLDDSLLLRGEELAEAEEHCLQAEYILTHTKIS